MPHAVSSAFAVSVHVEVPLHEAVKHPSSNERHLTAVPAHPPLPSQASAYVHAFASSHDEPAARLVTVHDGVPLQTRCVHGLLLQVTLAPPPQTPVLEHVSP